MRNYLIALTMLLAAPALRAMAVNFGPTFANGGLTYENGKFLTYGQQLQKRRNIPQTFEKYVEKRDEALELVHKTELQEPGKSDAYWTLKDVLDYGWANSWSKKNPGLHDALVATGTIAGMVVLIAVIVLLDQPNHVRGARR